MGSYNTALSSKFASISDLKSWYCKSCWITYGILCWRDLV